MRSKLLLFFLSLATIIGFTTISCKKSNQNNIQMLFASGPWQLASKTVTNKVGDTTKSIVALDTLCNLTQIFTFNIDGTCTYTNYGCVPQPVAKGHWSLSANQLLLTSDVACQDSTGSVIPFKTARIMNLGQYSLVLLTGDLQTYYAPNQKRTQIQYGFVRVKTQ